MSVAAPQAPRPTRRSIAGNAALLMVSQGITWVLGLVVAVVLPRHLGPAVLGQLHLGVSLWAIAAVVVAAGTNLLLTKEFARDPVDGAAIIGSATTLQLYVYAVAWVGVAGFVALAGYDPDTVVIIGIIGLSIVLTPFAGSARSALYGLERMEYVAATDVATKLLHVLAVLAVVVLGAGVRGIAWLSILYWGSSAALLWFFLRRFGVSSRLSMVGVGRVARRSRTYLMSDVTVVAYQQIDVIVISLLVHREALGWYSTADGLFATLLFLPTILMTSLFPAFSRLHAAKTGERDVLLARCFDSLLVIAIPVGVGTLAIAQPLAVLLFGPAFAGTGPVLAVLGVVLIFTYLTILLGRYALAIDRQTFWIRLMVGATVATVALDLMLVPWTQEMFGNGAIGGALAYLVTESVMLLIGVRILAPELVRRSTFVRLAKSATAAGVMLAAVWPLREAFLALPVLAGAATYAGMLALLRVLDAEEIEAARTAVRQMLRRVRPQGSGAEREVL